jgi:hypothetical protein
MFTAFVTKRRHGVHEGTADKNEISA